jgi:hypothetical protein
MMSILSLFYFPVILEKGYFFSNEIIYYSPRPKLVEYINSLPFEYNNEIFKMNGNAEIYYLHEGSELLVITLQKYVGSISSVLSNNNFVLIGVKDLESRLPKLFEISLFSGDLLEEIHGSFDPLTVILKQELERF